MVWQVFGKSKEKIGNCSGRRAKGGRARWFGKSLASLRRRLAIVLVGGPRVAKQDGLTSLWQVEGGDWQLFWWEGQWWQQKERKGSTYRSMDGRVHITNITMADEDNNRFESNLTWIRWKGLNNWAPRSSW